MNRQSGVMIFRVLIVLASLTGVILTASQSTNPFAPLRFFTIQSNVMVIVYFSYRLNDALRGGNQAGISLALKGALTLYMSITGLVYHFVLVGGTNPLPGLSHGTILLNWANFLAHYVTPIMVVLDWLLCDRDGRILWRNIAQSLLYPLAYAVFALLWGSLSPPIHTPKANRYIYPFLNVDALSLGRVLLNILLLLVVFCLVALLLQLAQRGIVASSGRVSSRSGRSRARGL